MASLRTLSRASTSTIRTLCPLPLTRTRIQPFTHSPTPRSSGHESHYDPPSGWLFGVKPGEKYEKEGWEGPMYWGMCGAVGVAVVAYAFKPDTRYVYS